MKKNQRKPRKSRGLATIKKNTVTAVPQQPRTILAWLHDLFSFLLSTLFHHSCPNTPKNLDDLSLRMLELEKTVSELKKQVSKLEKRQTCCVSCTSVSNIPPPPPLGCPVPPPPPPPPLPLPATQSAAPTIRNAIGSVGITAADLGGVKLRKAQDLHKNANKPPVRSDTAKVRLVTLQDLQNVRLKARQVTDENRNLCSPKKDVVQVKKLRKTNIVRSPGGTPLVRRNPEDSTGDGLTPALAHALRKKFQAIPGSPAGNSPGNWRC